jgi:hypothetical protein
MPTAAELIAQTQAATTLEELDAIEAQAEARITVLHAVAEARGRVAEQAQAEQVPSEERQPDFVWVGCNTCWQPQDPSRPVRAYAEWQADGMRYRAYFCPTCSQNQGRTVEVHPTLYAIFVDDWRMWREGGPAAQPTEVKRWGV